MSVNSDIHTATTTTYIAEEGEHKNDKEDSSQTDIDIDYSIVDALPPVLKKQLSEKKEKSEKLKDDQTIGSSDDDEDKTKKPPTVGLFELFKFSNGTDKLLMLIGSLGATVNGTILPLMTIFFGRFITAFGVYALAVRTQPADTLADAKQTLEDEIKENILFFLALGVAAFVSSYVQMTCWMIAGENQAKRVREFYYAALLRQDISWFDAMSTGEVTTRITADTNIFQEGVSEKVGMIIQYIVTFISAFVIGFVKGWKLALVLCCVIPLLALAGGAMSKAMAETTTDGQDAHAGAGAVAEQAISGVRTVFAFGGEKHEIKRYFAQLQVAYKSGKRKAIISGLGLGSIFLIMFCTYGLGFWYGSRLVERREKTGGEVLNTFFAVMFGAFTLGNSAPHFSAVGKGLGAAASLFSVISRVPPIDVSSESGKKLVKSQVKGRMEFRNLNFHYPQRPDVPVLKNFSLTIEPGQTVALVGSSGSGKSTIVGLLERFYDPISGSILLDGDDIKDINIKSLRTQIGLVGQEPVLFPETIAQNIKWGGMPNEKEPSLEEVIEVCKKANANEFIEELPDKYDTLVGEKGSLLSGGQKQRIAIARALIKDPAILLLDEATSALDSESERLVQTALDAASTNRTTIVVAHRLSTIKNADNIVVMSKGEIVETGKHDELIERKGMYYDLVKAQELKTQKKSEEEDDDEELSMISDLEDDTAITIEENLAHKDTLRRMSTKATVLSTKTNEELRAEEEAEAAKKKAPFGRVARLNASEWPLILAGSFGSSLFGAQMPLFSVVFAHILETLTKLDDLPTLRKESNFWAGMFVLLGLVAFIGNFLNLCCFSLSAERLTRRLRDMAFRAIMAQEIGFFDEEKNNTGALTSKLAGDASKVEGLTGSLLGTVVQTIVAMSVGMIIAFANGWKLTLVVLSALPLVVFAGLFQMKTLAGYGQKTAKAYEDSGQIVQQSVSNMRTIAALSREESFKVLYGQSLEEPHKIAVKGSIFSSFGFGLSQAVLYFIWSLSFWYGSRLQISGEYSNSQMNNVLFTVVFSAFALGQIGAFAPNVAKAKIAAIAIFELVDRKSLINVSETLENDRPTPVTGTASAHGVRFNYPARPDVPILRGFDLSVLAGKTVAIVGSSGSGKSTVVSLVLRYYDVASGSVKVEHVNVREWNLEYLRSNMALVGQEPVLFDISIGDNIRYGKEGCTQEEIEEAAKAANIHNFIESLPEKYNTRVGEKGSQLSGGQKQRIAIARALIRQPKLLLLDEATSALDSESEKVVQNALDRAAKNRTTITIAHRLSTIQNADLILVVKKGQVVEQGNHMELIARRGLYFELVNKQ
ncbi:9962_t:CDS:10, partial [Ambispora gerdemannii]